MGRLGAGVNACGGTPTKRASALLAPASPEYSGALPNIRESRPGGPAWRNRRTAFFPSASWHCNAARAPGRPGRAFEISLVTRKASPRGKTQTYNHVIVSIADARSIDHESNYT